MFRGYAALAATVLAGVLLFAQGSSPAIPLTLLSRDGRRVLPTTVINGQELVALDDLTAPLQVAVREDALAGGVTVAYKGRTIVVSTSQAMASVAGRLIALPAAPVHAGRRWLVPVEFISRALALVYDTRLELRKGSRLVILGDVRVPKVSARIESAGSATRVIVDVTPALAVAVTPDAERLVLHVEADAIDMTLPVPGSGLVEQIRQGDQPTTLIVTLRPGAGTPRATTAVSDAGTRVTVDISPAGAAQSPTPAPPPLAQGGESPGPLVAPASPRPTLQAIALDPGHGGDDAGTKAADGGAVEKELTLEIARRAKALIEARLGIRVLLTREDDKTAGPDERAAVANNNRADVFLSLHFNAAATPAPNGAEIYYLSLDREAEAALNAAQAESVSLPVVGGGTRPLDLIRWDMAQARHVDAAAALAGILEETFRAHVPMGARPLQQAPMRALVGVNMPAALIEIAYLSNPHQATQAMSADFQGSVVQAIYDATLRFREYLERK